jgi:hypothetical protein
MIRLFFIVDLAPPAINMLAQWDIGVIVFQSNNEGNLKDARPVPHETLSLSI